MYLCECTETLNGAHCASPSSLCLLSWREIAAIVIFTYFLSVLSAVILVILVHRLHIDPPFFGGVLFNILIGVQSISERLDDQERVSTPKWTHIEPLSLSLFFSVFIVRKFDGSDRLNWSGCTDRNVFVVVCPQSTVSFHALCSLFLSESRLFVPLSFFEYSLYGSDGLQRDCSFLCWFLFIVSCKVTRNC